MAMRGGWNRLLRLVCEIVNSVMVGKMMEV